MLQAVALGCSRGERRLFSDLNVKVDRGTLLAVVGENGTFLITASIICILTNTLPHVI